MSRTVAAFLVVATAGFAGCTGDSAPPQPSAATQQAPKTSTTVTAEPMPDADEPVTPTSTPVTAAPTTTTSVGAAASGAGSAAATTTTLLVPQDFDVRVSLAHECVPAGGTQTITVDIGRRGGVAYSAVYADGKSGVDDGHYGGNAGGPVDDSGRYRDTWTVAVTAPPGPVHVDVVALDTNDQTGSAAAEFVVGRGTECAT